MWMVALAPKNHDDDQTNTYSLASQAGPSAHTRPPHIQTGARFSPLRPDGHNARPGGRTDDLDRIVWTAQVGAGSDDNDNSEKKEGRQSSR